MRRTFEHLHRLGRYCLRCGETRWRSFAPTSTLCPSCRERDDGHRDAVNEMLGRVLDGLSMSQGAS